MQTDAVIWATACSVWENRLHVPYDLLSAGLAASFKAYLSKDIRSEGKKH